MRRWQSPLSKSRLRLQASTQSTAKGYQKMPLPRQLPLAAQCLSYRRKRKKMRKRKVTSRNSSSCSGAWRRKRCDPLSGWCQSTPGFDNRFIRWWTDSFGINAPDINFKDLPIQPTTRAISEPNQLDTADQSSIQPTSTTSTWQRYVDTVFSGKATFCLLQKLTKASLSWKRIRTIKGER